MSTAINWYWNLCRKFRLKSFIYCRAKLIILRCFVWQGYSLVKEKKALKISSELDYLDKRNEVNKIASLAWSDYQLNQSRLDLAKAQLKAAEIAFEGIEQEYESGQRTTLDVLSSRGLLLEARLNLINSERNEILSRFYILKTIGNLTANFLKLEAKIYNPEEYSKKNWIRHLF